MSPSTRLRVLARLRQQLRRAVEDYRTVHVAQRCRSARCDCPCGYCRHDRRHVPGG